MEGPLACQLQWPSRQPTRAAGRSVLHCHGTGSWHGVAANAQGACWNETSLPRSVGASPSLGLWVRLPA
eukprot:123873-Chlamydomonas_euryale.AAC.2